MVSHSETKVRLYQRRIATAHGFVVLDEWRGERKAGFGCGQNLLTANEAKGNTTVAKENLARDTMGSRIAYNSASV
jgi:hypothetical protein